MKKFIKRHMNRHKDPAGADEDSVLSSSSPSKVLGIMASPFKILGRIASPRKSKLEPMPETVPESAPLLEEAAVEKRPELEPEPEYVLDAAPEPVHDQPTDLELHSKEREAIYADDNTGKKDDCACFAECVIL